MEAVAAYERELGQRFLDGLPDGATVYGLQTMEGRVATFLGDVDVAEAVDGDTPRPVDVGGRRRAAVT